MRAFIFIILVLASGALAGFVYGLIHLLIAEPYLDTAILIEHQKFLVINPNDTSLVDYTEYRVWQKSGLVLGSIVIGISMSALFSIIFTWSKKSLIGNSNFAKSVSLAVIMWITLYVIPTIKYPVNLPGIGDAETLETRTILYLTLVIVSGASTVSFYALSKRLGRKYLAIVFYIIFMSIVLFVFPSSPDISPTDALTEEFRIASVIGSFIFWVLLGVFFVFFQIRFGKSI